MNCEYLYSLRHNTCEINLNLQKKFQITTQKSKAPIIFKLRLITRQKIKEK